MKTQFCIICYGYSRRGKDNYLFLTTNGNSNDKKDAVVFNSKEDSKTFGINRRKEEEGNLIYEDLEIVEIQNNKLIRTGVIF